MLGSMKRAELYQIRKKQFANYKYRMKKWDRFNYEILSDIMFIKRAGTKLDDTYNDCIIMIDTETSKKDPEEINENHVCAFTVSIRAYDKNIVTLYGHKPDDLISCMEKIHNSMQGTNTIFYCHNYSYDFVFLRKFMYRQWGTPLKALFVKPHYPIYMIFKNNIILKDSLILSQKSLERWANDLEVEHRKEIGKWDYLKVRNQSDKFSRYELDYIEHDTLAGVECIDATMKALKKRIYSIPLTATGIPREEVYKRGIEHQAHKQFQKISSDYDFYQKQENAFHGGYVHGNRYYLGKTITDIVKCFDFSSSYPYCILSQKFPIERFLPLHDCDVNYILRNSETNSFIFKLILYRFEVKNKFEPMPMLQFSKMVKSINCIQDNGRVLQGEYAEIYLTEWDLKILKEQYIAENHICTEVYCARKDYLPKWFTDYVYELYKNKTTLKGGDPVDYAIAKAKLNSCYGMMVQKAIQQTLVEDILTGEFKVENRDSKTGKLLTDEEIYQKYINNKNKVLPYQWGIFVTSMAFYNLFQLGKCFKDDGIWLYSDTDSCYGTNWDEEKILQYNKDCMQKLKDNGYEGVEHNGRIYYPGVAELDGTYSEFRYLGAKRYACRNADDNKLKITVAGVPKKKGALCLNDDIENFAKDFIFPGTKTGKQQHTYFFIEEIYEDKFGNITGDSIDLSPCDYRLDPVTVEEWEKFFKEDLEIITYEENMY